MKVFLALMILTSFLFSNFIFNEPDPVSDKNIVRYADSLFNISLDSGMIAGASILVFQDGKYLLDKSYGYASLELSAPMPEHGSFEIGSVTKQFTAAAILKLAEDQKLSLDDDFIQYLKFDTKGRTVTIRHLLDHTSGIASYTEIPEFWTLAIQSLDRDSLVRMVEQHDFLFEPGEALIYNNSGYFFLGLIIEKITGMSYEMFLQEAFFNPLGMNNTYYCTTTDVVANKVYGYNYSQAGLQQKPYLDHTWPFAAGSLCSTTEDLLIWMKALHEGKVLNENEYHSLITPGKLNQGDQVRYAKGLTNFSNYGHRAIQHGGGIHGFLSETRFFPEEDLYIICLVNTTGPHGAEFFADAITWQLLEKKEPESVDPGNALSTFTGNYSGQVRGRKLEIKIESLSNGLLIHDGENTPDTLKTYLGNNTWRQGNNIIRFAGGKCKLDYISGYYILQKE